MSDDLFNFEIPSFDSADNGFEMTSDFSDFDGFGTIEMETRIHKPKKEPSIKKGFVKASNATDLIKKIDWSEGNFRHIAIVSGNFEFGDFIGQIFKTFEVFAKKMTISTLSLSENNIEMLGELVQADYVDEMQIIVSDYWYSHEKHNLMKMLYDYVDFAALRAEVVDQGTDPDTVYFNKKRKVLETIDGNDVIHFYELERSSDAESVPDVIRPTTFSTASPYQRAYVWKLKQSVEITSTDKNWLQNMLIDNVRMEYLPDYEVPVETIEVTEVPNESVKQTLEKTLYHGDLDAATLDDNYKYISRAYVSTADGTPITGGWQRRGVTENFTSTQLLGKMIRGQYQDIRWKLAGQLHCPDGLPTFWNTLHEVRTGKVYQFMALKLLLRNMLAEFEAIETLAGGTPVDESTDPGGTPGTIEPPVETRIHSDDFSSDFN